MDEAEMRRRVERGRIGHLATVTADQRPHVVPCCFALDGEVIVSAVDAKPKSTIALRRLDNVRANPAVSLLVDHYDDGDWTGLWWVRVDGRARVVTEGDERDAALVALTVKYPQYRSTPPPGPAIIVEQLAWHSWP